MNIKAPLFTILSIILLYACNSDNKELMVGSWDAVSFIQEDSTYQIDLSKVKLSFDAQGNYCYQSNLLHEECGHFKVQKEYLSLKDTTREETSSKNLAFEFIDEDSLKLNMMNENLSQILIFKRR